MTLAPDLAVADRYRLLERIAVGGMGEVWRARDTLLDRDVAVKVLKAEYAADPSFLERFRNEAKHTAALSHPGIANVFDYGEIGDMAFLVMELVAGDPLSVLLAREGALPPSRALDIVGQAALALQAAHDAGVIHRDVKPANLIVRADGVVKVTDFGIARAVGAAPVTQTGFLVGTAAYVSPEQAAGRPITPASDLYSLGVVAYECLTGAPPFTGDSAIGVASAHVHTAAPPLPDTAPPLVSDFVMQSLDKTPERRPRDAGEFGRTALALAAQLREPDNTAVAPTPTAVLPTADARGGKADAAPAVGDDDERERRRIRNIFVAIGASVVVLGFLLLRACAGDDGYARVPNVVGERYPAAARALQARGFDVERKGADNAAPAGTVLRQSVPRGTRLATDAAITLTVSTGPRLVTVDASTYVGRPLDDVRRALAQLDLRVSVEERPAHAEPGTVTAIEPTGPVEEGSTVTVTVAAASPDKPAKPKHGHGGKAKGHDD